MTFHLSSSWPPTEASHGNLLPYSLRLLPLSSGCGYGPQKEHVGDMFRTSVKIKYNFASSLKGQYVIGSSIFRSLNNDTVYTIYSWKNLSLASLV